MCLPDCNLANVGPLLTVYTNTFVHSYLFTFSLYRLIFLSNVTVVHTQPLFLVYYMLKAIVVVMKLSPDMCC